MYSTWPSHCLLGERLTNLVRDARGVVIGRMRERLSGDARQSGRVVFQAEAVFQSLSPSIAAEGGGGLEPSCRDAPERKTGGVLVKLDNLLVLSQ